MEILWPYIVKKKTRRHRKMSLVQCLKPEIYFTASLSSLPALNLTALRAAIVMVSFVRGLMPVRSPFSLTEKSAESYEGYFVVSGEGLGDGCGGCVEGCLGVGLGQVGFLGDSVDELSLVHKEISYWCFYCANILIKLSCKHFYYR